MQPLQPHAAAVYRPDIDGLRAVAIVLVLVFHLDLIKGGFVGVDVFFVISGYLITGIILKAATGSGFSFAHFYERRIRRLFPALFAALAASTVAACYLLFPAELEEYGRSLAAAILFVANLYFYSGSGYFAEGADEQPLHHTWSLAVEEQFYLFFPVILLALLRLGPVYVRIGLWAITLGSFVLSQYLVAEAREAAFYLLPSRTWELSIGALLAIGAIPALASLRARQWTAAVGMLAIVGAGLFYDGRMPFPGASALLPCIGTALIIHSGGQGGTFVDRLLTHRWLVALGLMSYSLYVWHFPIIVLYKLGFTRYPGLIEKLCLGSASLVFGYLSWRYVEHPIRFGGWLAVPRKLFAAAVVVLAAGTAAGVTLVHWQGFPLRFDPEVQQLATYRRGMPPRLADGACFINSTITGLDRVDQRCITPEPGKRNLLLVGDSHASHLWAAFEETFSGSHFMQLTGPGCFPSLDDRARPRCRAVMEVAFHQFLPRQPVEGVVVAGNWTRRELPNLLATVRFLRKFTGNIIVIGPVPTYDEKLPRILARSIARQDAGIVDRARIASRFTLDDEFARALSGEHITYVSAMAALCDQDRKCVTRAADGVPLQFDYGHFTLEGARLFAERLAAARTPGLVRP